MGMPFICLKIQPHYTNVFSMDHVMCACIHSFVKERQFLNICLNQELRLSNGQAIILLIHVIRQFLKNSPRTLSMLMELFHKHVMSKDILMN